MNDTPSRASTRRLDGGTLVSLVIPCYNEQEVFPMLVERVRAEAQRWDCRHEVILVDDGSTDGTWTQMEEIAARDDRWRAIRLARNFGHQAALWRGLSSARGDVIAVLDADLQDPPEVLPRFLEKWADGYDVIYAVRQKRKENAFKRLAYFLFYRVLTFLADIDIPLDSGDFCVMDRRVLDAMLPITEKEPFVRGLRAWVGFRQTGLEYERSARAAGEAKYGFRKLVKLASNGIFSFSTKPLRLATHLGLLVSFLSFAGAAFTLLQRIFAETFASVGLAPVPGFATIVISILFIGGVQLVCIGILGEYIGRIYENVKGRPHVTVSESVGFDRGARPAPPIVETAVPPRVREGRLGSARAGAGPGAS